MSLGVVGFAEATAHGLGTDLLGSKGAGLAAMTGLGLAVPAGFIITTDVGRDFLRDGMLPPDVLPAIRTQIGQLERVTGRRLGGRQVPLVVSVRSGAAVSMPGMMSTVLDLGAVDPRSTVGDDRTSRFALDTYRRFLRGFATTVLGLDDLPFAALDARSRDEPHADERRRLAELIRGFEDILEESGCAIPDDPMEQLELAIVAVLRSWESPRARTFRELHGIRHDLGTAVTIQRMVFGNRDRRSATGVAFSRDPTTGEPSPYGDLLFTAQGEDVVAGREPTDRLVALAVRMPDAWEQLLVAMATLEVEHRDMCNIEFTIESGVLWLLQVRPGGRTDRAAVRIAVELVREGSISTTEAVQRIRPAQVRANVVPGVEFAAAGRVLTSGLGASPGVVTGRIATTAEEAMHLAGTGAVILVRPVTSPVDIHGIAAAAGVLTSTGGLASHAAVVARSMAKPAVVGASAVEVDAATGTVTVGLVVLRTGDMLSIDGTSGTVVVGGAETSLSAPDEHLETLLRWADDIAGAPRPLWPAEDRIAAAHTVIGSTG